MEHAPVMLAQALEQLAIKNDGIYLDCTFGRGGHSSGILNRLGENGHLIALDRDSDAINSESARKLLADKRFQLLHSCFSRLEHIITELGLQNNVDGVLIDSGVSSPQLDNPDRGFSFLRNGELDMRMDRTQGISAGEWLSVVNEQELARVLFEYGEERFARRIAKTIIQTRCETPITTTHQLAKLIAAAVPFKDVHKHPATRSFQAIRIEINNELDELNQGLQQAARILKPEGRLVVISFHSLEDRQVKRFIRNESGARHDPGKFPVKEQDIEKGDLEKVGRAIKADVSEINTNPRARSAVMRVARRVVH
jgi:16S rRNA (cytosine1402-N4)-methyltransferase